MTYQQPWHIDALLAPVTNMIHCSALEWYHPHGDGKAGISSGVSKAAHSAQLFFGVSYFTQSPNMAAGLIKSNMARFTNAQ